MAQVLHNYDNLTPPKTIREEALPQSPASAVLRGKTYHPAIPLHIVVAKTVSTPSVSE